jgi:hypothetical protein
MGACIQRTVKLFCWGCVIDVRQAAAWNHLADVGPTSYQPNTSQPQLVSLAMEPSLTGKAH